MHTLNQTALYNLFENEYEKYGKLHNESAMLHCTAYYVVCDDELIEGEIHLTNFLLYFVPKEGDKNLIVPIASIAKISEQQKSNNYTEIVCVLRIYRCIRFRFASSTLYISSDKVVQMLRALAFPKRMIDLFAFEYYKNHPMHSVNDISDIWGWNIYDIESEYNRMGIFDEEKSNKYRFSRVNTKYDICQSYPELFVVPSSITDWELLQVSRFRRLGRIPILSWKSITNNVALFRCSQPKVAMASNRSRADEHLIQSIVDAVNNNMLYIMDARPKLNARVNKMRGGGFENTNFYKNTKLEFLNIDNIHIMRKSRKSLANLLCNNNNNKWYQSLGSTEWMNHIQDILKGVCSMINVLINKKCSILCHCSDGWDRTSQLSSLVQLCLDPYYRSIKGFIILINKEWLSVGHQFDKRCGHRRDDGMEEDERSPIFEQFIECIYQLLEQYPLYFEFNDNMLICILDHLYSCKYGTFLCDNMKQRQEYKLSERTLSLWTHIQNCSNSQQFMNIFYEPSDKQITPKYSLKILKFWNKWHFRNYQEYHDNGYEDICHLFTALKKENDQLKKEIESLRKTPYVVEIEADHD